MDYGARKETFPFLLQVTITIGMGYRDGGIGMGV